MKASDIMVTEVITAKPSSDVHDIVELLLLNRISAVPVVNDTGGVVGMVSKGDLIRRSETDTRQERSWWPRLLVGGELLAAEYLREHASNVANVMTRGVISADPDTPVTDIATLLERRRIKRVPIVRNGKVAGIVSRANLIQALATCRKKALPARPIGEAELREKVVSRLRSAPRARPTFVNMTVTDGTVDLWGVVSSSVEKKALRTAVEVTLGVKAVNDNVIVRPVAAGT